MSGATAAAGGTVAMLRNRQPGAGDHKCRSCRDVEGLRTTRSRPRGVNKTFVTRLDANSACPHAFRQPGKFVNGLSFQLQSDQRGGNLGIGRRAVEQRLEQQSGVRARKILAARQTRKKRSKRITC